MDNCCKVCLFIVFGVVFTFIGFIMLMYGLFYKPSSRWANSSTERANIQNTRIAGPIFLLFGIGLFVHVVFYRRRTVLAFRQRQGNLYQQPPGQPAAYPPSQLQGQPGGYPPPQQPPSYSPSAQHFFPPPQQYPQTPQQHYLLPQHQPTFPGQQYPQSSAQHYFNKGASVPSKAGFSNYQCIYTKWKGQ